MEKLMAIRMIRSNGNKKTISGRKRIIHLFAAHEDSYYLNKHYHCLHQSLVTLMSLFP
jgi:hypothetical protein